MPSKWRTARRKISASYCLQCRVFRLMRKELQLAAEKTRHRGRANAKGPNESCQKSLGKDAWTESRIKQRCGHLQQDEEDGSQQAEESTEVDLAMRCFAGPHHVVELGGRAHGDAVVGHGDGRKQQHQQQHQRDQGSPLKFSVPLADRPHPSSNEEDRQCCPGEIEKKLHSWPRIAQLARKSPVARTRMRVRRSGEAPYFALAYCQLLQRRWQNVHFQKYVKAFQ